MGALDTSRPAKHGERVASHSLGTLRAGMVGANVDPGPEVRALRCRHGEDLPQAASTAALAGLLGQKGCRAEGQTHPVTEIAGFVPNGISRSYDSSGGGEVRGRSRRTSRGSGTIRSAARE